VRASPCPGAPDLKPRRRGRARGAFAWFAVTAFAVGCAHTVKPASQPKPAIARPVRPPPPPPPPAEDPLDAEVTARLKAGVEYGPWHDLGGWVRYISPKGTFLADDGGVDVAFQFHGAEVAERDWRQSGLNALVISVTFPRWGTTQYKVGFSDPIRFGIILDDVMKRVGATHVRRLLLVSWSAGYAAMGLVLANAHYYALADTAIVLDGLHADYIDGKPNEHAISIFERYASDAVGGKKTMVVVHSSIVPPGYASTTEMAELLCASVGAHRILEEKNRGDGLIEWYHSDAGALHVRGYRGEGPKEHLDQLHLLDDLVREHVTPRWTRLAVEDSHRPKEPPAATP
jgi:hypothetical protein